MYFRFRPAVTTYIPRRLVNGKPPAVEARYRRIRYSFAFSPDGHHHYMKVLRKRL